MLVACDFDGCLSIDPEAWRAVMNNLRRFDHEVLIVTSRKAETPVIDIQAAFPNTPIYVTNGEAKRTYLMRQGMEPDVWIDDCPALIDQDAKWRRP